MAIRKTAGKTATKKAAKQEGELVRVTVRISARQKAHFVKLGGGDISEGVRRASGIGPYKLARGLAGASQKTRDAVAAMGVEGRWGGDE